MQPPQRGIPRLLAMKDPTNPVLMHMSPMEAQQITAMRGQGFNPQTGLPVLGRAEGGMVQPEKPPYADIAQELEEKGRYGDTHLLHVRDDELQGLSSLGQLTINPDTGLPEAFSFKSLIPALVGTAVTIASGGTMAPLMAAGMGGLATFGTSMAMGNSLQSSLLSGFMTFGGGAIAGGGPSFGVEAGAGGIGAGGGGLAADMGLASAGQMVSQPLTTVGTGLAGSAGVQGATTAAQAAAYGGAGMGSYMPAIDQINYLKANPGSVIRDGSLSSNIPLSDYHGLGGQHIGGIPAESALPSGTSAANLNDIYNINAANPIGTTNAAQQISNAPFKAKPATAIDMYKLQGEKGVTGRIDPKTVGKTYEQGFINRTAGKLDINPTDSFTRSGLLEQGIRPPDATIMEKFQAFGNNPAAMAKGIGLPVVGAALTADPYIPPEGDDIESSFSTPYTPRERTLVGGRPRAETFEEIQERMLRGSGGTQFQPFSPHRFVNEGGLVGLNRGGRPREGGPPTGLPPDTGLQANSFARGLMMAMDRITNANEGGLIGLNKGGMANGDSISYNSNGNNNFNIGEQPEQMPSLPISLQHMMNRLGVTDPAPFIEFAKRTRDVESSGGRDRVNDKSSARGNYQWLTKVDPKAKKGEHNSVKTASNRLRKIYRDEGQDIPQWLKTLDINSTKSTKDLEKNVLSLTSEQEDQLFYANINLAEGSDQYLPLIAQGDTEAMLNAYGEIHHTNMKKPTRDVAENIFLSEFKIDAPINVGQGTGLNSLSQDVVSETMVDKRMDTPYTVQQGDTLSQLAAQSGISVDDIMKANLSNISDQDKIYTGQQIALSDSPDISNRVPMNEKGNKSTTDSMLESIKELIGDKFITRSEGGGIGQYYAQGGRTGQYYEGQVIGQGDGMSDEILFEVEGNNPDKALLSRDEYVIPADVVAMLGNGSSNAGADQLDHFMKGIRQQSFGTPDQQQQMNPQQGLAQLV